jgi:hypothetical protein
MSEQSADPSPRELVGELVGTLQELQRTVGTGPADRRGLDRLRRFTTEVTIPATILVLQTNVKMLQLVQRALRLAEEEQSAASADTPALSQSVVDRIDEALTEVQSRIDTESADERTRELLSNAQTLNRRLEQQLIEDTGDEDGVAVDVDAELASLKEQYDDAASDEPDADEGSGDSE